MLDREEVETVGLVSPWTSLAIDTSLNKRPF